MNHKLCLLTLLALGCAPERPACAPAELAAIEARFLDRALRECAAYERPEDCPALPQLELDRKLETDRWVQCR